MDPWPHPLPPLLIADPFKIQLTQKMILYWCKTNPKNVGDVLNVWLWRRLIPELESLDPSGTLFGIGSILDARLNSPGPKYILGSGARSNNHGIRSETDLKIFSLRGPLTAKALNVPTKLAATDPASIIIRLYENKPRGSDIGIIPYFSSSQKTWSKIAENLGYRFISPHLETEEFLSQLMRCNFVITEAMHGAILADSLRIPFFPIQANSVALEGNTNYFKWKDWSESLNLNLSSVTLPPLWSIDEDSNNPFIKLKKSIKMNWIEKKIKSIVLGRNRFLSSESVLNKKLDQLEDAIYRFRKSTSTII